MPVKGKGVNMLTSILRFFTIGLIFAGVIVFFSLKANAEEIHFDNSKYILKYSTLSPLLKGYMNEYYPANELINNWTKMIGIYYYPNENSPIKFAKEFDKTIENSENSMLIKFIENKKQDKAVVSFLVNNTQNGKNYFEYNVYKYEKHPKKGTMMLKYAIKYFCANNKDITAIGNKIREQNDKYMEMLITSPIPPIVEKEIK